MDERLKGPWECAPPYRGRKNIYVFPACSVPRWTICFFFSLYIDAYLHIPFILSFHSVISINQLIGCLVLKGCLKGPKWDPDPFTFHPVKTVRHFVALSGKYAVGDHLRLASRTVRPGAVRPAIGRSTRSGDPTRSAVRPVACGTWHAGRRPRGRQPGS